VQLTEVFADRDELKAMTSLPGSAPNDLRRRIWRLCRKARRTLVTLSLWWSTPLPRRSATVALSTRRGLIPLGLKVIARGAFFTGRKALVDAAAVAGVREKTSATISVAGASEGRRRGDRVSRSFIARL